MATKKVIEAAAPTQAYTATTLVEHDQVKYGPGQDAGDELELTDAQAMPLLAVGAVNKLKDAAAA